MSNFFKSQFLMLAFAWISVFIFISLGGTILATGYKLFIFFYFWIPGLVALYYAKKENLKLPLWKRGGNKIGFSILLAIICVSIAAFFTFPFCEMRSSERLMLLLPRFLHSLSEPVMLLSFVVLWIMAGIVLTCILYLVGIFGQEIMFRGYAWAKLKQLGFWKASWLIGLFWGLWIFPMILIGMEYFESQFVGALIRVLYSVLLSPLLVYLRIISKGLLAPSIFFGVLHHVSSIFPYLFHDVDQFYLGMQGFTGLVALGLINLILFLKTRKTPLMEYEL